MRLGFPPTRQKRRARGEGKDGGVQIWSGDLVGVQDLKRMGGLVEARGDNKMLSPLGSW